ncbi:hypothetical protein ACNTMW_11440 [Planosporangium sp. 12N6]|uniref:hypothetical protein n=1 Tax=Planosporangium spinosum TaxID=3402278 RepID=UPI003CED7719
MARTEEVGTMRIRIRRWWRRAQPDPLPEAASPPVVESGPEHPPWADAPTCLYDTVDPVRPYVIRECDG